jgi:Protein of unknown function (DUF2726)
VCSKGLLVLGKKEYSIIGLSSEQIVYRELKMVYLKKILVNKYEAETDAALREAADKWSAKVFSKVGLKDTLNIDEGKIFLTKEEYNYAFKAHFDFVVTRANSSPVFAVEYDGSMHYDDPATIERDKKKNDICQKLGMPLFRIDFQYLKRVRNFSLIGWLTELWFIYESWVEAQERGIVPHDEPFLYFSVVGYDLSAPSRVFIQKIYNEKRIQDYFPKIATAIDDLGYARAIASVKITEDLTVLGHARCLFFMTHPIPSIDPHSLSEELAIVDAAEKLKSYLKGEYQPLKDKEVREWHDRFYKWGSIELRYT